MPDNSPSARTKSATFPVTGPATLGSLGQVSRPLPEQHQVDDVDVKILQILQRDSRRSQRAIAKEISMSAPAVGERIARLERIGVIQRYTISIDWARLGYPMVVYIPVLAQSGADIGNLMKSLAEIPEVDKIDVVTGSFDLYLRIRARDHRHLTEVLLQRIWQIPELRRTETLISLAEAINEPLDEKLLAQLAAEAKN